MREAGYSDKSAKNPKNLTDSKYFRELLDLETPQEEVAKEMRNLLYTARPSMHQFPLHMDNEDIINIIEDIPGAKFLSLSEGSKSKYAFFTLPDARAKKDALDMLNKIRGTYAPVKMQMEESEEGMSNDELNDKIADLEDRILAKKRKEQHGQ